MNRSKRIVPPVLIFLVCWCNPRPRSSIDFDYESAARMLEVIQAIHDGGAKDTVEVLLDRVLNLEAYSISQQRYTNPSRSKENQVTLSEYKKFILSFLSDSVDTQGNRRIGLLKDYYADAVKNPGKYAEALTKVKAIPAYEIREALEVTMHWLPEGITLNANVIILFDIGGGAWVEETEDGRNHIAFNILLLLDEEGQFDESNFLGTLAHELHHIGIPLDDYYRTIIYDSLPDTSRLRLYTDYVRSVISEGLAQKFCSNAWGRLSKKPYTEKEFAAIRMVKGNWEYFEAEHADIHNRFVSDIEQILYGGVDDLDEFQTSIMDYWTWRAGEKVGQQFALGRRYYYGAELVGVINEGLGREALFEIIYDFRKLLPLYNQALKNLKPNEYERYLFSDDVVEIVKGLK